MSWNIEKQALFEITDRALKGMVLVKALTKAGYEKILGILQKAADTA